MENIYDDLENYEEGNIIADLRNENKDLKKKLQQYSSTLNELQRNIFQDFDKLSSEYKKLQLNYSSLLTTARAEIERKTNMITQLNVEKDKMVIEAFQSTGKRSCNSVPYYAVNKVKSTATNCESSQSKKNNTENEHEHSHLLKQPRLRSVETLDRKNNKSKILDTSKIEGKHSYYNAPVSSKSSYERYSRYCDRYDDRYRQRDKSHHRQCSPKRITHHRSRSPLADRYNRYKSNDRSYNYYDGEYSKNYKNSIYQNEQYATKHKLLPHSEEPNHKKMRVDSYSPYPSSENSLEDGEINSFSSTKLISPDDPFRSCQSPDNVNFPNDVDQSLIKEIVHTAFFPQDDPRINSKKYIVQKENGKEVIKSRSSINISLKLIDPLHWQHPEVIVPDDLLQKLPSIHSIENLDLNNISYDKLPDSHSFCNKNVNPNDSSTVSEVYGNDNIKKQLDISCAEKKEIHSKIYNSCNQIDDTEAENIFPLESDQSQTKCLLQRTLTNIQFINDDVRQVDEGTVDADLLSSEDATDYNANKPTTYGDNPNECNDEIDTENKIKCTELNKRDTRTNLVIEKEENYDKSKPFEIFKDVIDENEQKNSNDIHSEAKDDVNAYAIQPTNISECVNTISPCKKMYDESEQEKNSGNLPVITKTSEDSFTQRELNDMHSLKELHTHTHTSAFITSNNKTLTEDTSTNSLYRKKFKTGRKNVETAKNVNTNSDENLLNEKENSSLDETCNKGLGLISGQISSVGNAKNNKTKTHDSNTAVGLNSKLNNTQLNEESTNKNNSKVEKPKIQEPKRKGKVENQTKENVKNKKDKKTKSVEKKIKQCDTKNTTKSNAKEDETTIADTKIKFKDLFGENSNSLILPEDLGVKGDNVEVSLPTKFTTICDDTQSAVDLTIEADVQNKDTSLLKECNVIDTHVNNIENEDIIKNYTVICKDIVNSNLYENLNPAVSIDSSNVVIISTGVQSKFADKDIDEEPESVPANIIHPLKALATSTPLKIGENHLKTIEGKEMEAQPHEASDKNRDAIGATTNDSEVPDLRIFVKRRRKLKRQ